MKTSCELERIQRLTELQGPKAYNFPPSLKNIITSSKGGCADCVPVNLTTRQQHSEPISLPLIPSSTLRVTLAWTDFPDARIMAHLQLSVLIGTNRLYGNHHVPDFLPVSNGLLENNVQKIVWPNPPRGGTAEIRVECTGLTPPVAKQEFALVWYVSNKS